MKITYTDLRLNSVVKMIKQLDRGPIQVTAKKYWGHVEAELTLTKCNLKVLPKGAKTVNARQLRDFPLCDLRGAYIIFGNQKLPLARFSE